MIWKEKACVNFLRIFMKKIMPEDIRVLFENEFSTDYSDIMENVYRREFPNRYLASFTQFLKSHEENTYCNNLVKQSFYEFAQRNILQYPESKNTPVSFVGSVAYFFEQQLKEILSNLDIETGKIIRNPIDLLVGYHS